MAILTPEHSHVSYLDISWSQLTHFDIRHLIFFRINCFSNYIAGLIFWNYLSYKSILNLVVTVKAKLWETLCLSFLSTYPKTYTAPYLCICPKTYTC